MATPTKRQLSGGGPAGDEAGVELAPMRTDEPAIIKPKISLQQAARDGKYDVVKEWLEWYTAHPSLYSDRKGRSVRNPVNDKDPDGLTALHYAARFNRFNILAYLLTERPDVNVKTEHGFTPLHYSAKYLPRLVNENEAADIETATVEVTKKSSSARAIGLLLQSQADVNAQDVDGLTPLAIACQRGNFYAVDRLLRAEHIDIMLVDNQGSMALHEACEHGSVGIVELLLKKGAMISAPNKDRVTPLHIACREGYTDVVKLLLLYGHHEKNVLVGATDNQGSTALHFAVESGVEEIVGVILLNGADPIAQKNNEVTPLHIAARNGHIGIADLLLQYKEQSQGSFSIIEMIEIEQNTPLHFAARYNKCEMIKYLKNKGANIEALDEKSFTPLLTAVAWSKNEAVKCLLELGAAIDAIDKDSKSGVFWATKLDAVGILKIFAEYREGRELCSGTDSFNNYLLHVACKHGNGDTLKYLLEMEDPKMKPACRNEVSETPLHLTAKHGHVQCMKMLIYVNKELVPLVDDEGNSALHLACIEGFVNVAKVLIEDGAAAVDARNDKQWTPMDCAANHGHEKLITLLIDCDAPIDAKDRSLETPLTLACREGHISCVKVLVEGGADVRQKAQNGLNCLDLAIENGHEDIAHYLVTCSRWRDTLRNCVNGVTPLRRLIRKMPEIAVVVFNNCTTDNNGMTEDEVTVTPDSHRFKVTFDYEFLEDFREKQTQRLQFRTVDGRVHDFHSESTGGLIDTRSVLSSSDDDVDEGVGRFITSAAMRHIGIGEKWENQWGPEGFNKSNHPLNIMVDSERITLLSHPLVTSLLRLKWQSYGRWIYWFNLSTYLVFLVFLTLYAILLPPPNSGQCNIVEMCILDANETRDGVCDCEDLRCSDEYSESRRDFLRVAAAVLLLFSVVRLGFEAAQMLIDRVNYFTDWENWIELILFVSAILFASGAYIQCCVCVKNWQWQLGAAAVFLAWLDLVLFMKKLPLFGVYVVMYIQIIYTFLRFMFLALLFIIAFGLAFYMLFVQYGESDEESAREPFRNPARSLLKTMVMTTGEFEFDTIFFDTELDFAVVSYLLWIIFIIFMPVLLTNLLVGLAVDDIKQVQEDAELKRLALQVELTLSAEKLISRVVKRRFLRKRDSVYPNRENTYWEVVQSFWGVERYDAPSRISRAVHPQQETEEMLLQQNRKLTDEVHTLKATVNEMSLLVHKMAESQGIDLKDTRN